MTLDAELDRIREFVAAFDAGVDSQCAGVPHNLRSHEGIGYLLLDASVNEGASAEFIRDLMGTLHNALGDDLLAFHNVGADVCTVGDEYIRRHQPHGFWPKTGPTTSRHPGRRDRGELGGGAGGVPAGG